MSKENQESTGNWLTVVGAVALFGSLFLTWSHQLSPSLLTAFGSLPALQGVVRDPDAWQVYSAADVVLAMLALALIAAAAFGSRSARQCALLAAAIALIFVLHAIAVPPTNGTLLYNPSLSVPNYVPNAPGAGVGETVALLGLLSVVGGLMLSFASERRLEGAAVTV